MAKPRALRRRIRSVENTRKITRTMEMVSTSKLKRAQDRVVAARPYAQALGAVIGDLLSPELAERFPLMRKPVPPAQGGPRRAAVLLITSNRGLAGAFNATLIRAARERDAELEAAGYAVDLHVVGKKGVGYFRFVNRPVAAGRVDIGDRPSAAHAEELVRPLIAAYEAGQIASLDVVFAHFVSAISTPPQVLRVLPVQPEQTGVPAHRRPGGEAAEAADLPDPSRRGVARRSAAAALREEPGVPRAGGDRRLRARGAAHGDEERHRLGGRHAGGPAAQLQPGAAGTDHAGAFGDRGGGRSAEGVRGER